ncbi:MAG: SMC-Scp complex subunit ScpB [Clostridia bacterium]|nr:SMC-Scp complex subunit ScpB [Clostridia bacterium]
MKKLERLTSIIEAVVFLSGTPVAIKDLAEKLEASEGMIDDAVATLQEKYGKESGLQLLKFNKKLQFCSNPEYAEEVTGVLNPIKEKELSRSLLEVAAIIAYKQPVTRIDLEALRGANSEYAIQKLLELKMIEPVGRKDAVGRPVLFGTTDEFLKRFEIESLDALPDYEELLSKIREINGEVNAGAYLYQKPVLDESGTETEKSAEEIPATEIAVTDADDELPPIDEEEIPDFLKGEDYSKIDGD